MEESFIFEQPLNNISIENEYYTLSGLEDFQDDFNNPRINNTNDTRILAKKIIRDNNTIRFSVKLGSNGKIYNPISIYGEEKNNNFLDRICRNSNKFKEVNAKAFDMYIKFLKTKNTAWLFNAEREME